MVASRVGGKRPHAPESPVATIASWDLEKDNVQADPTTLSGKAVTARFGDGLVITPFLHHRQRHPRERKLIGSRKCREKIHEEKDLGLGARGALRSLIAVPVFAQNAEPEPKRKTSAGAPFVTVTVKNARNADLVQLQAAESGSANWKKVLVAPAARCGD
jgi:hypothetical protein